MSGGAGVLIPASASVLSSNWIGSILTGPTHHPDAPGVPTPGGRA